MNYEVNYANNNTLYHAYSSCDQQNTAAVINLFEDLDTITNCFTHNCNKY